MNSSTSYDPFSASALEDPFPHYARLRAQPPAHNGEFWIVSRYADATFVLSNPTDFSSAKCVGPDKIPGVPMMLTQDAPTHTRLRSLVGKAFTPRMIAQLGPRVRAVADHLLDRALARRSFEVVDA